MTQYFTKDTDIALASFLATDDITEKHQLFDKEIRPAFEKLIENLIFVYHFYKIDDVDTLKREALANLYEMIPKFDPNKGTKGFSYFNVVAKNWFVYKTRERKRKNKQEAELYTDLDSESNHSDPNFQVSAHEDLLEDKEMWLKFYDAMESWRERLAKKSEKQVLEAVIFLMKNPDLVTIYNKKAVYLYLRELTKMNTKQVLINLKSIKDMYDEWKEKYQTTGES